MILEFSTKYFFCVSLLTIKLTLQNSNKNSIMIKIIDSLVDSYDNILKNDDLSTVDCPKLNEEEVRDLCQESIDLLNEEPTLLRISDDVIIVGDIHGSIEDLVKLLKAFGNPKETKFLFLGDYVDRGANSIGVISLLLAYKCKYPENVYLIRGNHEFSHINRVYGFYEEVISVGLPEIAWEMFQDVFSYLPLAALVNNSIFCVHGGLSPHLQKIDAICSLQRPIPNYLNLPLVSDIVWSDPTDTISDFAANQRGSGVLFGTNMVTNFLTENNIRLIVRGHQCTSNGVHAFAGTLGVTVFSCSDYSGVEKNKCGAIKAHTNDVIEIYSFTKTYTGFEQEMITMLLSNGKLGLVVPEEDKVPPSPSKAPQKRPPKPTTTTTVHHHNAAKIAQMAQNQKEQKHNAANKSFKERSSSLKNTTHSTNTPDSQSNTHHKQHNSKSKDRTRTRKSRSVDSELLHQHRNISQIMMVKLDSVA